MSRILGCNSRGYPSQTQGLMEYKVVLVAGDCGDYAAYAGQGEKEWVAQNGDKMGFAEACVHFPGGQLQEERYRD